VDHGMADQMIDYLKLIIRQPAERALDLLLNIGRVFRLDVRSSASESNAFKEAGNYLLGPEQVSSEREFAILPGNVHKIPKRRLRGFLTGDCQMHSVQPL